VIEGAAKRDFFNHGQCCCAGSRLYRPARPLRRGGRRRGEMPSRSARPRHGGGTQMGPMVSDVQMRRVTGYLDSGKERCHRPCLAAAVRARLFRRATVLPTPARHESCARRSSDRWWSLPRSATWTRSRRCQHTPYGLGAASGPRHLQGPRAGQEDQAGSVWINCYNVFRRGTAVRRIQAVPAGAANGSRGARGYTEVKASPPCCIHADSCWARLKI